ncbi:hypothetical protein ACQ33O_07610 [Ferruginibacter sp. SUN002]|uniref:hypothetical protein n=1 Tax=Ferruginibacter sp. SUN002 TaxID=2937789 RepID=UPI003D366223
MIQKLLLFFCTASLLLSCGNNKTVVPNTDIDVARAFIRNALDNKMEEANTFVLQNEANKGFMDVFKNKFGSFAKDELEQYKNADIIINDISPVNDSITIINYSNSYKKDFKQKVKMVRVSGQWLVDLKYTFSGNL